MEGKMCGKRRGEAMQKRMSKIRIIHIFAPEIIKTDAENFRELVQRLTGKPSSEHEEKSKRAMEELGMRGFRERRKEEEEVRERIKEEEEIWRDANTGGGFLGGFAEFEHQFPFVESHDMDVYDHPQLIN